MDRKTVYSGVVALPGATLIGLWVIGLCAPAQLDRDELTPLYRMVLYSSTVAPLFAGVWRLWAGRSWHANGALLVSLAAEGFNCCGALYSIVKVTPDGW